MSSRPTRIDFNDEMIAEDNSRVELVKKATEMLKEIVGCSQT